MNLALQAIQQTTPEQIERVCVAIEQISNMSDAEADSIEAHFNVLCQAAIKHGYDPKKVTPVVAACNLVRLEEITVSGSTDAAIGSLNTAIFIIDCLKVALEELGVDADGMEVVAKAGDKTVGRKVVLGDEIAKLKAWAQQLSALSEVQS